MAATKRPSATAQVAGLLGGVLAAGAAESVELPEDRADALYHLYDGGGVTAQGPAVLLRKSVTNRVSLSASYYVDMVSNASIDVVTTASPFRERRVERGAGLDYVYRDAIMSVTVTSSKEPDYTAGTVNVDAAQEVFGGLTTVSMGFSRGSDDVSRSNDTTFTDKARHWRYRLGATQVVSPRWLASMNLEAASDDGYLGSPYRAARVFGTLIPERVPRTRSSRAIKLRAIGDIGAAGEHTAVRGEYRYYWDNWAIRAHTLEFGYSRYFGERWLADAFFRYNTQKNALFYSDNFTTETTYVSHNRQLATFRSYGFGLKAAYTAVRVPGQYEIKLNASHALLRFNYRDFTDVRNGRPYAFDANVLELFVSATF